MQSVSSAAPPADAPTTDTRFRPVHSSKAVGSNGLAVSQYAENVSSAHSRTAGSSVCSDARRIPLSSRTRRYTVPSATVTGFALIFAGFLLVSGLPPDVLGDLRRGVRDRLVSGGSAVNHE